MNKTTIYLMALAEDSYDPMNRSYKWNIHRLVYSPVHAPILDAPIVKHISRQEAIELLDGLNKPATPAS